MPLRRFPFTDKDRNYLASDQIIIPISVGTVPDKRFNEIKSVRSAVSLPSCVGIAHLIDTVSEPCGIPSEQYIESQRTPMVDSISIPVGCASVQETFQDQLVLQGSTMHHLSLHIELGVHHIRARCKWRPQGGYRRQSDTGVVRFGAASQVSAVSCQR